LLGNDLVRVDVDAIQRCDSSAMYGEWFHGYWNFQLRMSVKCPAIAAAAAIIGLTR
jgi:hypothetical protein